MDTLDQLRQITRRLRTLAAQRDELIQQALREQHSERKIGEAADMSGPAIHQRKQKATR